MTAKKTRIQPNRPTHYAPRQPRVATERGFKWWKAEDGYRFVGDTITPRSCARPFLIKDVRKIRWDQLIQWGTLRTPLDKEARQGILEWCNEFGLPGYLLATTQAIQLPRQVEEREAGDGEGGSAGDRFESFVPTHRRVGPVWMTSIDHLPPGESDSGHWDHGTLFRDNVPVAGRGWLDMTAGESPVLATDLTRLSKCLTVNVTECPRPGSKHFWAAYREPITDFLLAGRLLVAIRNEMSQAASAGSYPQGAYCLLQGIGWVPNGNSVPVWTGASLLNLYAHSRLVSSATAKVCEACGLELLWPRPNQRFCPPPRPCGEVVRKRDRRKRKKRRAKHRGPKTER